MPANSFAIRLNVSCQIRWAGTAFALSLIVTRVLPRALAHSNAARMIRSTPFAVLTSSATYSVPWMRPRPRYTPSVFSRKITKSIVGRSDSRTVKAQGREIGMQEPNGAKIHVQIQPESQTEEDVASVFVAGDPGVAQGAQEDRVDIVPEVGERGVGKRLFCFQIVSGGVGEALDREAHLVLGGRALDYRNRCVDDLWPNSVAGNDCNAMRLHRPAVRLSDRPPFIQTPSLARS